jgi:hypothetical protein
MFVAQCEVDSSDDSVGAFAMNNNWVLGKAA